MQVSPLWSGPQAMVNLIVVISFTECQSMSRGGSHQSGCSQISAVLPTAKNSPFADSCSQFRLKGPGSSSVICVQP